VSRGAAELVRPRVNAPLVLTMPGVDGEVRSRLEDLWGADLVVAAVAIAGRVGIRRVGTTMTVRWAVPPRGVLELPCTLVDHVADSPPLWVLRPSGQPRRLQRRRYVRADVMARAELEPLPAAGDPGPGATAGAAAEQAEPEWHAVGLVADLCEGGARVVVDAGQAVGAEQGSAVHLAVHLAGGTVRTPAYVVAVEALAGHRLQLRLGFELPERDAEAVRREVLRRQTEARGAGDGA
jgi:c-di-GMP-binding flagellar brake protein YcgR